MNQSDKKTNRQRINEAIAKMKAKTLNSLTQQKVIEADKSPKPGQAQRRQKRIDVIFERLPDGTVMEQTYSRARGWLLKMVVPMVQTGPGEQPFVKEFYHTGPKHLPAIEELYLKYRDWIKKSMVEATKTDG